MKTVSMKALGAAALAAAAMIGTPAIAAEAENISIAVRYSDLDLSTKEGQRALERRMENAAEQVCGIDRRTSGVALPSTESMRCYRETVKNFERQIAAVTERQQRG